MAVVDRKTLAAWDSGTSGSDEAWAQLTTLAFILL